MNINTPEILSIKVMLAYYLPLGLNSIAIILFVIMAMKRFFDRNKANLESEPLCVWALFLFLCITCIINWKNTQYYELMLIIPIVSSIVSYFVFTSRGNDYEATDIEIRKSRLPASYGNNGDISPTNL